jgi:hypothetical protein
MKSAKDLPVIALAAFLLACGGSEKEGPPAPSGGRSVVNKATDDIPTTNRKDMYLDRYRFGDVTDAAGIVVRETDWIPPGSTAAISLYLRNAPAGSELRLAWIDAVRNARVGEEVKPVGDKGFVTFKQKDPLPAGKYRGDLYFRDPTEKEWRHLGGHDFRVGKKS